MFRATCTHALGQVVEVTFDEDEGVRPDFVAAFVEAAASDYAGQESVRIGVERVPTSLRNPVFVWKMLTEVFAKVEITEGELPSPPPLSRSVVY